MTFTEEAILMIDVSVPSLEIPSIFDPKTVGSEHLLLRTNGLEPKRERINPEPPKLQPNVNPEPPKLQPNVTAQTSIVTNIKKTSSDWFLKSTIMNVMKGLGVGKTKSDKLRTSTVLLQNKTKSGVDNIKRERINPEPPKLQPDVTAQTSVVTDTTKPNIPLFSPANKVSNKVNDWFLKSTIMNEQTKLKTATQVTREKNSLPSEQATNIVANLSKNAENTLEGLYKVKSAPINAVKPRLVNMPFPTGSKKSKKKKWKITKIPGLEQAQPWVPSDKCIRRRPIRDPTEKFLVMLGAREQGNKNVAVVAMAARWAKKLGRTLVEPATCDSRVVSPFHSSEDSNGHYFFEESRCTQNKKVGLSSLWDLDEVCDKVEMISYEHWLALIDPFLDAPWGDALRDNFYCHPSDCSLQKGPGQAGWMKPEPPHADARVLYVAEWFRETSTDEIANGVCTWRSCEGGFLFHRSARLLEYASSIARALGRYSCITWRSETKVTTKTVETCAELLVESTKPIWQIEGLWDPEDNDPPPLNLLVTDLYPGTSSTYTPNSPQHQNALQILEKAFQTEEFEGHREAGVGGGTSVQRMILHNATVATSGDLGMRGELLQDICAAADHIVTCVSKSNSYCSECSRSMDSGFAAGVISTRSHKFDARAYPVNTRGGIWEWGKERYTAEVQVQNGKTGKGKAKRP